MARSASATIGRDTNHDDGSSSDRGAAQRETWAVRRYLNHLSAPRRRDTDPEKLRERLEATEVALAAGPAALERLMLIQTRLDLTAALEGADANDGESAEDLEKAFVGVAAAYSARRGISWAAWREVGVPAAVLRDAGITRS